MLKTLFYSLTLLITLLITSCDNQSVSPINTTSSKITGETKLVETLSEGTITNIGVGKAQIKNKIMIFKDSSSDNQLSGMRTIILNHDFDKNNQGDSYGTFSIETKYGYWEGDWTGTTTSTGTTIFAVGYNLDERDQHCEWKYFLPSPSEGKSGTYSAVIYYDGDEQF